jgi:hypothetical protein
LPISEKTQRLEWQLQSAKIPASVIEHVCACSTRYGNAFDLFLEVYARALSHSIEALKKGADPKSCEADMMDVFGELPPDVAAQGRELLTQAHRQALQQAAPIRVRDRGSASRPRPGARAPSS